MTRAPRAVRTATLAVLGALGDTTPSGQWQSRRARLGAAYAAAELGSLAIGSGVSRALVRDSVAAAERAGNAAGDTMAFLTHVFRSQRAILRSLGIGLK